ncbi:hypothetical protein ABPG74_014100 [Tetrahymena malaccensis]
MSIEKQTASYTSLNEINGLVLDQEKEYFNLLNIHIKSLDQKEPIDIDFNLELHSFLHANLLKPFDTQSIKMKYLNVILEPRVVKILKVCFWNIVCGRFPETVDILVQEEVQKYYKKKLSKQYIQLLQSLPQPKDELLNYVIFTISYLIHFCFYKYFPPQREFFDFRFILNCYHTVLYEFNGILVSDIFVKNHIEKYFTNKFLDYEKKNMKELLQRQLELKKLNNKKFLGFHLNFPDISTNKDGSEFKDKIMTYLKKDKSKQLLAIDDRNNQNHQNNTHLERNRPRNKLYTNQIDSSGYFSINQTKLRTESDSALNSLRMNCNQVSPTIGMLLEYEDLNLPFKKKKMIKHVFEKVDESQQDMINKMKLMYQDKEVVKKKEVKVNQRGRTLIDQYGLRAPPKEYYMKHQKLNKYFKDMLDINYVLTEQAEQMSKLPSSIDILNKYNNRHAWKIQQDQEQKALKEKLLNSKQQIQLLESMQKQQGSGNALELPQDDSKEQGRKLFQEEYNKQVKGKIEGLSLTTSLPSLINQKPHANREGNQINQDEIITKKSITNQSNFYPSQAPLSKDFSVSTFVSPKNDSQLKQLDNESPTKNQHSKKAQFFEDNPIQEQQIQDSELEDTVENHRKIKSRVMQKEEVNKPSHHGNLPEYILNRSLDPQVMYEDKRKDYKNKYKQIFDKISVDQNIDDLQHKILLKQNLMSHGVKKKH